MSAPLLIYYFLTNCNCYGISVNEIQASLSSLEHQPINQILLAADDSFGRDDYIRERSHSFNPDNSDLGYPPGGKSKNEHNMNSDGVSSSLYRPPAPLSPSVTIKK